MSPTVIISLASLVALTNAFTINAPASVPSNASPAVDKAFIGMSMEGTSFPAYTGNKTHPNTFSLNMFASLINRTGTLPIRIGGDTRDVGTYDPTQTQAVTFPQGTGAGLASHNTLGPSYLDGLSMIPGARWILGIPFALNNLSNSIEFLNASLKVLPAGTLDAIEVGNEVTQYAGWYRSKTFSPADYASQWYTWVTAITGNLTSIPKKSFWALSDADVPSANSTWSPVNVFKTTDFPQHLDYLKAVSMHYYQVNSGTSLQDEELNHNGTVREVSNNFAEDISYLKTSVTPSVPLVLGEVGPGGGGTGEDATSLKWRDSLGSAVWYVDFLLDSMVAGVQRVNTIGGHDGPESYGVGSLWLAAGPPEGTAPAPMVDTAFYAHILVAEIFQAVKGALRIAPLAVQPDGGKLSAGSVVGYAAYDAGKLNRVIVLNEQVWNSSASTQPRPSASVTLGGLTAASVRLEYLSGADSYAQNVTWAGQQWSVASNGRPVHVKDDTRNVSVANGKVTFSIAATEAIVVTV